MTVLKAQPPPFNEKKKNQHESVKSRVAVCVYNKVLRFEMSVLQNNPTGNSVARWSSQSPVIRSLCCGLNLLQL